MDELWPWIFAVGATVLIIGGIVVFDGGDKEPSTSVGEEIASVADDRHIQGPETAPVTLIEYSDFQCPACGQYYPFLGALKKEFAGQLRFVYRHFPIRAIHKNAELTGQASEAASEQGKFWEYHDLLFERQAAWSDLDAEAARETILGYARELGLDEGKFASDLDAEATQQIVDDDRRSGDDAGVKGTPTFILNGQLIANPQGLEEFRTLIQATIDQSSQTSPGEESSDSQS